MLKITCTIYYNTINTANLLKVEAIISKSGFHSFKQVHMRIYVDPRYIKVVVSHSSVYNLSPYSLVLPV